MERIHKSVTLTTAGIAAPVARYAGRLHALAGPRHHVASPLGAWLLLALCAPASEATILNGLLGGDPADAARLAAGLLARPDPVVPAAAAVWHRPGLSDVAARWLAGLPPYVTTGPLTSQAELDGWARRGTLGLIERFPVALDPSLYLLAATVLAARVSWERPFDLAPASALGPSSPWAGTLSRVLRTPDGPGHQQLVAPAPAVGDVAVHVARARDGLAVVSVAAEPGVPAGDVLAAAYDLAPALATGRGDLPAAVGSQGSRGLEAGGRGLEEELLQGVADPAQVEARHDDPRRPLARPGQSLHPRHLTPRPRAGRPRRRTPAGPATGRRR